MARFSGLVGGHYLTNVMKNTRELSICMGIAKLLNKDKGILFSSLLELII